ncbi:hypothetical protein FHS95_000726 [Sphingomonas naasensis]|uniref:Glycoside hydrolase family 65 n=1 Tax=Sphingomonas naasensis TaxID=1344951 RepID=A0A4S1WU33_9SPHN|nr:hypothetical protein [Sphingomonas naasensis]NIJ19057.1 hypothetical protein [Sphingomonas naasensis]TGX46255.1 hypothetical protein E5A74_03620 [Sphingomonas naasensis]
MRRLIGLALGLGLALLACPAPAQPIDRHALVARHNITLTRIDPHAPLMLGNGNLGFTADITGLQTFPEQYSPIAPLLTMAQWAWHSFPNRNGYTERDGLVMVSVPGRGEQPFPWIRDWSEVEKRPALKWLRENPHRFSLGRIGLALLHRDGTQARFAELSEARQMLDLWSGALTSSFVFDGQPVHVETRVHPTRDMVMVSIRSPLVAAGRIGVDVRYPGVSARLNPDPSDWTNDDAHQTRIVQQRADRLVAERTLDATRYYSALAAPGGSVVRAGPHGFRALRREGDRLDVTISFDRSRQQPGAVDAAAVARHWRAYWTQGGVIDFGGSSDPRAAELERRVVLSQYLAAINQAGEYPPQEEGLFSNSWNGKFHLEMPIFHAGHWASWGRPALLERSLGWYLRMLPQARQLARRHGVQGAWWSKMTGPDGWNSPSTVNPFIMWQQPHPIYLAELVWRARRDRATLARYGEMVEETARLLASWPRREGDRFVLGPPIIPVQENHPPLTTVNPAFELEYYRWALDTAQRWRARRGLARNAEWDRVIAGLAPPPQRDGLYLPVESAPDFWREAISPECSGHATPPRCLNRDHPSFLMAWGLIPGARVDPATMRRTLAATEAHWDLRQTWGWDFPVVAMTAARLGDRERAIDWLFRDFPNNRWGVNGMTPRVHLEEERQLVGPAAAGAGAGPDGPGFARAAETYFPSNGSLLLAVGMMTAGWDGSTGPAPGFPREGWKVRAEGIRPLP